MTEHQHTEGSDGSDGSDEKTAAQLWDARYSSRPKVWSGRPNPQLVAEASGLQPGRALDLGCGEGADAIWLADRGWTVTAVDVSAVALERAAAHALASGHTGNIEWLQQDLAGWVPERQYDLVSAQFLHSTLMPWQHGLRLAAAAVRPGGTLLVVGHHPEGLPQWGNHHSPEVYFTAEDVVRELGIAAPEWRADVVAARRRSAEGPDGEPAELTDAVLRATRLAGR